MCVCAEGEGGVEKAERVGREKGEQKWGREIYCLIWAPVPCIVLSASVLPLLRSLSISGVRESARGEGSPPLNMPDIHLSEPCFHSIIHRKLESEPCSHVSAQCNYVPLRVIISSDQKLYLNLFFFFWFYYLCTVRCYRQTGKSVTERCFSSR